MTDGGLETTLIFLERQQHTELAAFQLLNSMLRNLMMAGLNSGVRFQARSGD